jgi:hypothetical protein
MSVDYSLHLFNVPPIAPSRFAGKQARPGSSAMMPRPEHMPGSTSIQTSDEARRRNTGMDKQAMVDIGRQL